MKTTKIISVLSLALIFATANAVFSGTPDNPASRTDKATVIKYQVNVHHSSDLAVCGTYLIRLVYDDGRLVAPMQPFVPGITSYVFFNESKPDGRLRSWWRSEITATLILAYSEDQQVCPVELKTRPDIKTGKFAGGQTYYFNLYPNAILQKNGLVLSVKE